GQPVAASRTALAAVFREEAGRLTAWLTRSLGDFVGLAEDIVQEAILAALEQWPAHGIPHSPRALLFTVARRRAVDRIRRESAYRAKESAFRAERALVERPSDH